jgi:hypothetical protein
METRRDLDEDSNSLNNELDGEWKKDSHDPEGTLEMELGDERRYAQAKSQEKT